MTSLLELKTKLCHIMKELYVEKILSDIGGNLSIRSPNDDTIWISPSGMKKNLVSPKYLVQISPKGDVLYDKSGRGPSVEHPMHLAIYNKDKNCKAIIHSHPPLATAYSLLKNPPKIPLLTPEYALLIPKTIITPYHRPGSNELAKVVSEAILDKDIVIMENHGIIVASESLELAKIKTRAFEEQLQLYLNAKLFDREIRELPEF